MKKYLSLEVRIYIILKKMNQLKIKICDALEKLKNAMLCYFDEYHIENLENDIKSYNIPQKILIY